MKFFYSIILTVFLTTSIFGETSEIFYPSLNKILSGESRPKKEQIYILINPVKEIVKLKELGINPNTSYGINELYKIGLGHLANCKLVKVLQRLNDGIIVSNDYGGKKLFIKTSEIYTKNDYLLNGLYILTGIKNCETILGVREDLYEFKELSLDEFLRDSSKVIDISIKNAFLKNSHEQNYVDISDMKLSDKKESLNSPCGIPEYDPESFSFDINKLKNLGLKGNLKSLLLLTQIDGSSYWEWELARRGIIHYQLKMVTIIDGEIKIGQKWLEIAANNNSIEAQYWLAKTLHSKEYLQKALNNLNPEENKSDEYSQKTNKYWKDKCIELSEKWKQFEKEEEQQQLQKKIQEEENIANALSYGGHKIVFPEIDVSDKDFSSADSFDNCDFRKLKGLTARHFESMRTPWNCEGCIFSAEQYNNLKDSMVAPRFGMSIFVDSERMVMPTERTPIEKATGKLLNNVLDLF